ncbi:hypothetical protein FB381_1856 [Nocardioides albertanoniae]|uniref:Uncharacterized protein n=1 Tax=Nocardioides albertanoniae TaxID=1175486 RepID=A0A543A5Y7_9ACTN|nr:hypothetical protein [Nocardioides albertanoniae]TQL67967.1 hypothetical protein FB381_1856 [Nocardioides albertanoniae]
MDDEWHADLVRVLATWDRFSISIVTGTALRERALEHSRAAASG